MYDEYFNECTYIVVQIDEYKHEILNIEMKLQRYGDYMNEYYIYFNCRQWIIPEYMVIALL